MNAEQNTGMKSFVTHHMPKGPGDHLAYAFVKTLRFVADTFFAKRYGHRAVVLETVAAVPGMVGGLMQHPAYRVLVIRYAYFYADPTLKTVGK